MTKHIALLMGGLSSEREVSLSSGKAIFKALNELGYQVSDVDMDRNVAQMLANLKPDVVFNALHGTYGEDGCVPGMLEILGVPYTHSGVLASSRAMDKAEAKRIFERVGILCAQGLVASKKEILAGDVMPRPYVAKPVDDGSSVGVFIIEKDSPALTEKDIEKYDQMLVEQYIPGKELAVAVIDEKPLGVLELAPKSGFYDYKNKYTDGMTDHVMPADIPKDIYDEAMESAYKAHQEMGCRGLSRSDFRYDVDGDGKLYMLEINTHPGMTPLSLVPEIAEYAGISFKELIKYLVEKAQCEKKV